MNWNVTSVYLIRAVNTVKRRQSRLNASLGGDRGLPGHNRDIRRRVAKEREESNGEQMGEKREREGRILGNSFSLE